MFAGHGDTDVNVARHAMRRGGLCGAVFNAAKEQALDGFIEGMIGFTDMAEVVAEVMSRLEADSGVIDATMTLDNVNRTDHLARQCAGKIMAERAG